MTPLRITTWEQSSCSHVRLHTYTRMCTDSPVQTHAHRHTHTDRHTQAGYQVPFSNRTERLGTAASGKVLFLSCLQLSFVNRLAKSRLNSLIWGSYSSHPGRGAKGQTVLTVNETNFSCKFPWDQSWRKKQKAAELRRQTSPQRSFKRHLFAFLLNLHRQQENSASLAQLARGPKDTRWR